MRKLAREESGDAAATALDWLVWHVEAGRTQIEAAGILSAHLGHAVSRETVRAAAYSENPEEAEALLRSARARGAEAMADKSVDIVDQAPANRDAITKARAQSSARQWLAGKWNREEYGNDRQPLVQISAGTLHLEALRQVNNPAPLPRATAHVLPEQTLTDGAEAPND